MGFGRFVIAIRSPFRGGPCELLVSLAVVVLALVAFGCATTGGARDASSSAAATESAAACVDVVYRARVRDAESGDERRVKIRARACQDGAIVAEVRGAVGAAGLVAAVREGQARLLLLGEREAIDGPDEPWFWMRVTGVPFSGAWLIGEPRTETAGSYTIRIEGRHRETFVPESIEVTEPSGRRVVTLTRDTVRAADAPPRWPEIPARFVRRVLTSEP